MTKPAEEHLAAAARIDAHWDFGDAVKSEAAFRALLAEPSEAGPVGVAPPADHVAQIETQIARAQGLQRRFDEADATLDRVAARLGPDTPLARVRCLLERGRVRNSSGRPAEAAPLFAEALEAADEIGADFHAVDAAHMLGIVESGEAGQAWNRRALERAGASDDPRARGWAGSIAVNMGWWLHGADRAEEALAMFQRAVESYRDHARPSDARMATWCVGRCLRTLGRLEAALAKQETLLTELEAAGASDGYVHEEIGECLLALDRADEARAPFARAHDLLSKDAWLAESEPARLERLAALGGVRPAGS